jgi:hypothetical protein
VHSYYCFVEQQVLSPVPHQRRDAATAPSQQINNCTMAGRRIKRKAAMATAATRNQQKQELLEKKKAILAKARAAKTRKFQQRQKKNRHLAQMTTATATTASAVAGPAGPTESSSGGGSDGAGSNLQQGRCRLPDHPSGRESAGPATGRRSDPGPEEDSRSRDDVLEHAVAAQVDQQSSGAQQLGGGDHRPFIPSGVLVGHRILRSFGNDDGSEPVCGQDGCFILRTPMSEDAEEVESALFIGTVMSYRPPKAYEDLTPRNGAVDQSSVQAEDVKSGGQRRGRKKKKKRCGRPRRDAVRELDYALYRVHFDDGDVMDMEPKEVFECSQLYDAKVRGRKHMERHER